MLLITFIPNMVYDMECLKTVKIYMPDSFKRFNAKYKFIITINGV
jgi:hypothetical protein